MSTVEITSLEMVLLWDALREFRRNTVDADADREARALLKKLGCTQIQPEPEEGK